MSKKDDVIARQAKEIDRLQRQVEWLRDLLDRAMMARTSGLETR